MCVRCPVYCVVDPVRPARVPAGRARQVLGDHGGPAVGDPHGAPLRNADRRGNAPHATRLRAGRRLHLPLGHWQVSLHTHSRPCIAYRIPTGSGVNRDSPGFLEFWNPGIPCTFC